MRLICNRTQNDAIWGLIALFLTNQIAGNTIDFKMNVINHVIVLVCLKNFMFLSNIRQNINSTKTNSYSKNLIGPLLILVAISFNISLINFTIISLSVIFVFCWSASVSCKRQELQLFSLETCLSGGYCFCLPMNNQ